MFAPQPFVEPSPRHVRVQLDDVTVADTPPGPAALLVRARDAAHLRHPARGRAGRDLLPPVDRADGLPHTTRPRRGRATARCRELRSASRLRRPPSTRWPGTGPSPGTPASPGTRRRWRCTSTPATPASGSMPLPSDRHVRIELDGVVLAESRRPLALFETTLPTRWYLPFEDVHTERLVASDTTTAARTRGRPRTGRPRSATPSTGTSRGATPNPSSSARGSPGSSRFFGERVDLWVDGELVARPDTPWSQPEG